MVDRNGFEFKSVLRGQLLKSPDGLLPVSGVVVQERDRLSADVAVVHIEDMLDGDRRSVPVVRREVEDVAEHCPVGCRRPAVSHGMDRNVVRSRFRYELVGRARRKRRVNQRAFAFRGFVALDALLRIVAGLAIENPHLNAAYSAVSFVQHREIVGEPVRERNAAVRVWSRPIAEPRDDQISERGRGRQHGG